MLCALTVRKLKPGAMEDFKQAFIPSDEDMDAPSGWKHFYAVRNVDNEDEIVTFGFFDGTLEELRSSQEENGEYESRRAAADEFVESVGADGVFEVVEERSLD